MSETDNETESETVEPKAAVPDESKRRISMSADGRGVEVEGPDELLDIVAVAAELWKLTERPPGRPAGFSAATLYTELAGDGDQTDREDG